MMSPKERMKVQLLAAAAELRKIAGELEEAAGEETKKGRRRSR